MSKLDPSTTTVIPFLVEQIRNLIWDGTLLPGAQIKQADLAKKYNISHIPIREAMRILEADGLLENFPNKGVRVAPLSTVEMQEVTLEIVGLLSVLLPHAVPHLKPESFAKMSTLAREMDRPDVPPETHLEFWMMLVGPSQLPHLNSRLLQLIWRGGRYFKAGGKVIFTEMAEVHPNREDMLAACKLGDIQAALVAIKTFFRVRIDLYTSRHLKSLPPIEWR